jgi:hypothetical protein
LEEEVRDLPLKEKPWMMVPMIMMHEPNMMHHLRPKVSLMSGIRGKPMTDPSGSADARMPLYPPVGCPKSGSSQIDVLQVSRITRELTVLPGREQLSSVDDLRVEPGGHLDTDDTGEQQQVHHAQVRLLVPGDRILHRHAMDEVVRPISAAADHGCERFLWMLSWRLVGLELSMSGANYDPWLVRGDESCTDNEGPCT